jgi:hypothetical protein
MHPQLLAAYDAAIPRLRAQEQLAAIGVQLLAGGRMKREPARRLLAQLQADAREGTRRIAATDRTRMTKAHAQLGMGIRVHKRKGA